MKKREPYGKKNERKTEQASYFRLVEERTIYFKVMGKPKTANNYMCALKHFRKFRASKDLAIGGLSITTRLMKRSCRPTNVLSGRYSPVRRRLVSER